MAFLGARATAAALILMVSCVVSFQSVPPVAQHAAQVASQSRSTVPEAIDLYPAPGSPPAPGADGWFKDFGKQKMDPAMLKAAGISTKKGSTPAKRSNKGPDDDEKGGLAPVLGGFAVVLALVLATQAGN